jgi:hypothetical protein
VRKAAPIRGVTTKRIFATFEFLIELQRLENFLAWKIFRQTGRQIESLQKIDHCIALPAPVPALLIETAHAATIPRLRASP